MIELEYKYKVTDRELVRSVLLSQGEPLPNQTLAAAYLACPGAGLEEDGISVRVRREDAELVATVKQQIVADELRDRYEWELDRRPISSDEMDAHGLPMGWLERWVQALDQQLRRVDASIVDPDEKAAWGKVCACLRQCPPKAWSVSGGTAILRRGTVMVEAGIPWAITLDEGIVYSGELQEEIVELEAECLSVPDEAEREQIRSPLEGLVESLKLEPSYESKHQRIQRLEHAQHG